MNIALFAPPPRLAAVTATLEAGGHACLPSRGFIPGEADCLVVVGDAGEDEGLIEEAERAGLPLLRLPEMGAEAAAEAAAWGLGLADERYIEAARSDARVKRLEDIRVKMAEQRGRSNFRARTSSSRSARPSSTTPSAASTGPAASSWRSSTSRASSRRASFRAPIRTTPPLEFAHKFVPLNSIGGDFFDLVRIDQKTIALVIADVSGHGVGPRPRHRDVQELLRHPQ